MYFGRRITFIPPADAEEEARELAHAVEIIKTAWAGGWAMTLQRAWRAMSTQAAAEYLGISRPTLIKILERGEIPYRWNSNMRVVQMADLHDYERKRGVAAAASVRLGVSVYEKRLKIASEWWI